MPWLLVAGDDFFEVFAKVLIERDGRVAPPRFVQNVGDGPSAAVRRSNYGNRPMILLLDDHLAALFDFLQHRAHVAGQFSLGDPHSRHTKIIAAIARMDGRATLFFVDHRLEGNSPGTIVSITADCYTEFSRRFVGS
jgi:hypothetical protein